MDNSTIQQIVLQNPYLKTSFAGVWSADNFPKQPGWTKQRIYLRRRSKQSFYFRPRLVWFQIVNTSPLGAVGKHWLLLGAVSTQYKKNQVFVWDCLGQPLSRYKIFSQRLKLQYEKTGFSTINLTLQNVSSNMCGLYCLFMIDYIARNPTKAPKEIDQKLKQFTEFEIIRFMNCQYHTLFRYIVV